MGHSGTTLDLTTDVVVFSARAYLPALGLFTTTDPVIHAGPTPYAYADNDQINLVDPTGWSSEGWFDDWNSPGTEMVIVYGLTLIALVLSFLGPVGLIAGAILMLVVAGYQTALGIDAYLAGNTELAVMYWVNAGVSLAFAIGFGFVARSALIRAKNVSIPRPPYALHKGTSSYATTKIKRPHDWARMTPQQGHNMYRNAALGWATQGPAFAIHLFVISVASVPMGMGLAISGVYGYSAWEEGRAS